jgi:zinc finger SWIM domain-containing protein 3
MGGKAPTLITTDEDASMRSTIASVFLDSFHRLCMWHIMEKFLERVGPKTRNDKSFWASLNACVWGSESGDEFVSWWNALINKYGLTENAWMAKRFDIRESWIPAYFMDVPLVGLLRTTSRSESANSFFNWFILLANYLLLSFGLDLIQHWNASG